MSDNTNSTLRENAEPIRYSHIKSGSQPKNSKKKKREMKSIVSSIIVSILILLGVAFAVLMIWHAVEYAMLGSAELSKTDWVFATLLSVSLFANLFTWLGRPY